MSRRNGMDVIIKLAIRECAKERGVVKSEVTDHNILGYLLDKKLGRAWATIHRVRVVRATLPKTYQLK